MKRIDYYEICKKKLKYLNYSERTIETYLSYINKFLKSTEEIHPSRLCSEDFQKFLDNYNFTSISQQNQIINSIRFLYKFGLNRKYEKVSFNRPKTEKHLPKIIDSELLLISISKIKNLKHKTIISLAYSTGLRVSEIINLKIKDIDSKRMIIFINNGKGRKDRIVPLSNPILYLLRLYYKEYKPIENLFNGQNSLCYSANSCNKIVKKYIGDEYHFHLLRHSCFTHLIENGTDSRIIQKIAGHSNIKTTEGYMQVSTKLLSKVKLPI
jgi:site-specific recombinase XerD